MASFKPRTLRWWATQPSSLAFDSEFLIGPMLVLRCQPLSPPWPSVERTLACTLALVWKVFRGGGNIMGAGPLQREEPTACPCVPCVCLVSLHELLMSLGERVGDVASAAGVRCVLSRFALGASSPCALATELCLCFRGCHCHGRGKASGVSWSVKKLQAPDRVPPQETAVCVPYVVTMPAERTVSCRT